MERIQKKKLLCILLVFSAALYPIQRMALRLAAMTGSMVLYSAEVQRLLLELVESAVILWILQRTNKGSQKINGSTWIAVLISGIIFNGVLTVTLPYMDFIIGSLLGFSLYVSAVTEPVLSFLMMIFLIRLARKRLLPEGQPFIGQQDAGSRQKKVIFGTLILLSVINVACMIWINKSWELTYAAMLHGDAPSLNLFDVMTSVSPVAKMDDVRGLLIQYWPKLCALWWYLGSQEEAEAIACSKT